MLIICPIQLRYVINCENYLISALIKTRTQMANIFAVGLIRSNFNGGSFFCVQMSISLLVEHVIVTGRNILNACFPT